MTTKNTPPAKTPSETESAPEQKPHEETPFEAAASICSVLVVGLFILTFLAQNFVIPSGSMEKTLLVGDHLVVDRVTLAPPTKWMPLVHYREPKHGDIVVFIKPGTRCRRQADDFVPCEAIDRPARRSHPSAQWNRIINGVVQPQPHAVPTTPENFSRLSRRISFCTAGGQWRSQHWHAGFVGQRIPKSRGGWRPRGSAWEVLYDGRQSPRQP